MFLKRKFDTLLVLGFIIFSWWLMYKSFGYDGIHHQFRIARHEIGDFGLHLSLIRSFSWGNNFPPESPFFPGKPLPYHYYFDLFAGVLERMGMRIDLAFNGLSIIAFTLLLFFIYKLPQAIFKKSRLLGILAVLLFLLHGSLTFVDFFKGKTLSLLLLKDLWVLPDYIHKGPFDGSLISIFFTLNVFLNQRHLILALAVSLGFFYFLLQHLAQNKKISNTTLVVLGLLYSLTSRIHTLVFVSTLIVTFILFVLFKRYRAIFYFFIPVLAIFSIHLKDILSQNITHTFFNPGFLAEKPLTIRTFFTFWFLNLGLAFFLIPLSLLGINKNQKKIFLSLLPLFIIGNLFQLSYRIDHNHTLFNFFFIFMNFYIAFFLVKIWNHWRGKIVFVILLFFLIISGIIDLMPIKNDFRYPIQLGVENRFLRWIKEETQRDAIFLARQEILDPITLAGRKNFLGHSYYREVMGYDSREREKLVKTFFEAKDVSIFDTMRKENIRFMVISAHSISYFPYAVDTAFFKKNLQIAYEDREVIVFKL